MQKARYFFEIMYQGTAYHGWQKQKNALSIQEVIEDRITKITGQPVEIVASGRTDHGVHALQQFFHADLSLELSLQELKYRLNAFLPRDIAIRNIFPVTENAHARYSAYLRGYQYYMHQEKNPFLDPFSYYFNQDLNLDNMNKAAQQMQGQHDFKSFSKVKTNVNHFICEINEAQWTKTDQQIVFKIKANRFLRGMVRTIVGSLIDIGIDKKPIAAIEEILKAKDRKKAGKSVPACGLFLSEVHYNQEIFIA